MTDYLLCGWHVRSDISLPELPTCLDPGGIPNITITYGIIPPSTPQPQHIHVASDGSTMIAIPEIGRFWVRDGRHIMIDPLEPRDEAGIRLFLLGTVFAVLCYQREIVPWHASCFVPAPDLAMRAVMVSGESGVGKSTLAATLAIRGTPILADDVCVLDLASPHAPYVLPTVSRLKLWRDSMHRLDLPINPNGQVRRGIDKYAWYGVPVFRNEPTPLAAVYYLTRSSEVGNQTPRQLSGLEAVKVLRQCIYRPNSGMKHGKEALIMTTLMNILAAVPVFMVSHNPSRGEDSLLAEQLMAHWRTIFSPTQTASDQQCKTA